MVMQSNYENRYIESLAQHMQNKQHNTSLTSNKKPEKPTHDLNFLVGGGEMGAWMQMHDWSNSPLGPLEGWSPCLKSVVAMMLPAAAQIALFWGEEYVALYNDAYH